MPRIIAVINPANVASIRVAQKIGMKYEREESYKDFGKVAVYVLKTLLSKKSSVLHEVKVGLVLILGENTTV